MGGHCELALEMEWVEREPTLPLNLSPRTCFHLDWKWLGCVKKERRMVNTYPLSRKRKAVCSQKGLGCQNLVCFVVFSPSSDLAFSVAVMKRIAVWCDGVGDSRQTSSSETKSFVPVIQCGILSAHSSLSYCWPGSWCPLQVSLELAPSPWAMYSQQPLAVTGHNACLASLRK